jgi:hypothetical protein
MSGDKKVKTSARGATGAKKVNSGWAKVRNVMKMPGRYIAKMSKQFWKWVSGVNVVAMTNITLLVAIIVLFVSLIMDVAGCCNKNVVVVVPQEAPVMQKQETRRVVARTPALPVVQNAKDKQLNVVPVKKSEVEIAKRHIARQEHKLSGDVVIDSRGAGTMLQQGTIVNGNLYLQDMHKYTLPCDVRVNGNVFLRDLGLLQFCGDFTITGNIYVSPRSSFGPIPRTARLGGRVVL